MTAHGYSGVAWEEDAQEACLCPLCRLICKSYISFFFATWTHPEESAISCRSVVREFCNKPNKHV